jgi:4-amino-4-deoxy-L-arabinose transferase-like glycosyltransferase
MVVLLFPMRLRSRYFAIAASLFFVLAGQAFIPLLGVEDDEALFGMAFLKPRYSATIRIGHSTLPLMIMTYLGTLKAWIYRPILKWFHPGAWSLREPMLLAGALSIWLFYLLLKRMAGERAAIIGSILLATDSVYLLTTCFDWGPVTLQHLLIIGGLWLLLRFYQEQTSGSLAAGAFLLGLALWDKALAAWMLSGMGIAALLLFWRQIRGLITWRRAAICVAAFLLGSLPLWTYNVRNDWATFRGNFHRTFSEFPGKTEVLRVTLNGQGLLGYLAAEDSGTAPPHQPSGALQNVSARIAALSGEPRHHLGLYALGSAILLIPFAGRDGRRALLFALIAMSVAWVQMAITANAGGAVHHTILLWPLPQLVVAVSFAAASERLGRAGKPLICAVVAVLAVSGVLLTNEYYYKMFRNGPTSLSWSEAIFPLNTYVQTLPATNVYCLDWGILDSLRYLSWGRLPLVGSDARFTKQELTAEDHEAIAKIVSNLGNLYVAHAKEVEIFPDNQRFLILAAASGYRPDRLAVIDDSFGHPTFEVYRLVPASQ